MLATIRRNAYRASQVSMLGTCLAGHRVLRGLTNKRIFPPPDAVSEVRRRYFRLLQQDLENVERGDYPPELLFQVPLRAYLRRAPLLALDLPRTVARMQRGNFRDLPKGIDKGEYPAYFRRNFHWQTDGYFSDRSAQMYDVGVEFLFLGMADVMRRQVIPPISQWLREHASAPTSSRRLLDVACGTGRTLKQIAVAHPELRLFGLDLSPHYLKAAARVLHKAPHLSLVHENAETMPFVDEYFDVVTSVHLFHELPRAVRRRVYGEMLRVLKPGGLLIIQDSAQARDAGPAVEFLERFSREFHEPFHSEYLKDDIADALREQGFEIQRDEPVFVAKMVVARKPGRVAQAA